MRLSVLSWPLVSTFVVQALASPAAIQPSLKKPETTVYNGITVPPITELSGQSFEKTIKDGYWFVKFFSPYCPHCQEIAPTWQTLYEVYQTSKPESPIKPSGFSDKESPENTFENFYNFHFASLDCTVHGDQCLNQNVSLWPTFILYHNGENIGFLQQSTTLVDLSKFMEKSLEKIHPGSRPTGTLKLPKPGATEGMPNVYINKPKPTDAAAAKATATPGAGKKTNQTTGNGKTKSIPQINSTRPNPHGTSVPFSGESFQQLVTNTQDPWFIKFYAPWCHHCQALAPIWNQVARDMQGKLNVGEVNCDVERRLCSDASVYAYPTLYLFRGGERTEYEGLRGLGDLVSFANNAADTVGRGVEDIDAGRFTQLEQTQDVLFVYFYDIATTSEDFRALDKLTMGLVNHGKLVKTSNTTLTKKYGVHSFPRLLVTRSGRPTWYTPSNPREMRDYNQMYNWMKSVWLPLVPELTVSNAHEIMDRKYVVMGILNRQRTDEFAQSKVELKNAALEWMEKQTKLFQMERQELRDAKQLRIEEAMDRNDERALRSAKARQINIREDDRKQVAFTWIDGVFWERWLRTTYGIDIKDGERVIINDEENHRYWDHTTSGASIMPSRTSILETLSNIVSSPQKLVAKSTVGAVAGAFFKTRSFTVFHPFITLAMCICAVAFAYVLHKNKVRRNRGVGAILGYVAGNSPDSFHLDGKESSNGGVSYGKVD